MRIVEVGARCVPTLEWSESRKYTVRRMSVEPLESWLGRLADSATADNLGDLKSIAVQHGLDVRSFLGFSAICHLILEGIDAAQTDP